MRIAGIYKIESPIGEIYIGQSRNIIKRWSSHKSKNNRTYHPLLKKSFLEYGIGNHKMSIICELPQDVSSKIMDDYEVLYMETYAAAGIKLLNLKEGGRGGKHNVETLDKIGLSKIGNKNMLGKKHSSETRALISKNRKGKGETWNKGQSWSEETKAKMSASRLGKEPWNKGKKGLKIHTEEGKKLISERFLKYWAERKKNNK